jgi:HAE1 family hydrophobic/amphiphilic exporter-1
MGVSVNIITMTGLMLALGMLVDNSVVVAENIARLRAGGTPPAEAAVRGTGEVGMAIVMGTLTTVIVFVPLPFMGSRAFLSFIFGHLSFPIAVSLVSSLVVAALFVPLAARWLLGTTLTTEPGWFASFREGYQALLRRMLARRLDSAIVLALLFATVWLPLDNLKYNLFGTNSMRRVRVSFTHSPVHGLEEIEAFFDRVMARLDADKDALGIRFTLVRFRRGGGTLSLFLKDAEQQPLSRQEFFPAVRRAIGEAPGVSYSLRDSGERDFERLLTVRLLGPKPERLAELARHTRDVLAAVEGLGELSFEQERPPHEVAVVIDRAQAERSGVTARDAARRVAAALRGTRALPRFRLGEDEIEVVVEQDPERSGFGALTGLRFKGAAGMVPFDSVARIHFRGAPELYRRIDGKVSLDLEGPVEGKDFRRVNGEVRRIMNAMRFPPGYGWEAGGEGRRLREDRGSLAVAMGLALAAIFMVMGVLFESFLLPLTVLTTIPLALFGSAWLMFLTDTAMDTTGMIGMVILAGVVVNNGIVMVDRINRERRAGRGLEEAIVEAGGVRLRPILMTALTTVFGLLPMVFGYTNVAGYSFVALGRVVTGGLLAATVLTLFVVPLTYHTLVKIEGAIREAT